MNYDLFLSDFDGTLVRADGTISNKNIKAIETFRRRGGIFAVVTGRMLSSIRPRLKELGLLEGLVVAYQGAVIADIGTGELLKNDHFREEQALEVIRFLEDEDQHIQIYNADTLYCNMDDELLKIYEKVCGVKGVVIENEKLSEMIAREHLPTTKVLVMLKPDLREGLISRLIEAFGETCFITASSEWMVEIMPKDVSKAQAVKSLAEHYRVPIERVAAIGDQLNDLPMIEAAGGKFAVANAVEKLKETAVVVPSVEEDGVAVAIGKYVLGEKI